MELHQALLAAGEALLIGFLIGAQREASRDETEKQPGVRDFTLISLIGALCALVGSDGLTVCAFAALTLLLAVYHLRTPDRSGVTTEVAAVSTFLLGYLTATPRISYGTLLAVALTIAVIFVLEAKATVHEFVRKRITETEFRDTIRFLALVFVIYPVLPTEPLGPYEFFDARKIWIFIIVVCSISYFGYFLRKFAGERAGTTVVGVLGGIASSTAATAAFARMSRTDPAPSLHQEGAAIVSNALQFPRVLVLLYLVNAQLAREVQWELLAASAAGILLALALWHRGRSDASHSPFLQNPFSLGPALRFGAILTAILFLSKAAVATFGTGSVQWVGMLGGLADADAVLLATAELHSQTAVPLWSAATTVFLALAANAVTKTAIAGVAGTARFARRLLAGFALMFGAGAAAWFV
jgi:uncharacterized membrane protein (DUF4010 family)